MRYAIKNYNAEKHFAADIDNIYIPPRAEGLEPEVRVYLKDIREDDVFKYIERSELLSQTSFSNIYELMYSTQNFNSGLGAEAPTLSVSISVNINDEPKMEIVFEDGEGYPYAEVPLTEKEKAEINSFIEKEFGCKGSEYAECLDEKKFENLLRDVPYDETTAFWREIGKLDEYDDKAAADKRYADLLLNLVKSAKLNREKFDEEVRRRNKEDLEDKDGDHIPDRIDSSYSPDGFITQTDIDYRIALVTNEEYEALKANGFKCQKSNSVNKENKIAVRYNTADKENFEKIINSLGGKNERIHI